MNKDIVIPILSLIILVLSCIIYNINRKHIAAVNYVNQLEEDITSIDDNYIIDVTSGTDAYCIYYFYHKDK